MIKKPDDIAAIFNEEWPARDRPDKDKLAVRTEISKRLLSGETDEYVRGLKDEVERLHAHALEAYENEVQMHVPTEDDTRQL